MNETTSFLQLLKFWIEAQPLLAVLIAVGLPVVLIILVELLGGGDSGAEVAEASAEPVGAPTVETAVAPTAPETAAPSQLEVEPEPTEPVLEPVATPPPEPAPEPEPEPEPVVEPEPVAAPAPAPAPPQARLGERLRRTREGFVGRIGQLLSGRTLDAELLDELEVLLYGADLGVQTADALLERVRKDGAGGDAAAVRDLLKDEIRTRLAKAQAGSAQAPRAKPHVILVLGVNGSGKTTTIGKLAARFTGEGHKVVLGAGDTFRAAASEQLQIWGERVGCDVVTGTAGGDPSAVAFDTVKAAVARKADIAIIDTAGRLQTKKPLMEELGKLVRVIGKGLPEAPHETLLVLDANTGQNALSQAELFTEVAGVTGLVLTKLDGTAKGGVIVGLADRFGIPVRYVGVGESIEDLRDFSADDFADALFEE